MKEDDSLASDLLNKVYRVLAFFYWDGKNRKEQANEESINQQFCFKPLKFKDVYWDLSTSQNCENLEETLKVAQNGNEWSALPASTALATHPSPAAILQSSV